MKEWMPAFRLGLASLPEASVVTLSLSQPQLLGLSAKDAHELQKLTEERYALMAKDSLFRSAPSALPYCFAETRPAEGLATMHVPKSCAVATPCIVFLHGYGGSFLWTLHVLAEAFPDYLIVCPAYGMSCGMVPREYVREAIEAAEKKLGFTVAKPALVGLSAGGFGACMLYTEKPDQWQKMICLAAYAQDPALSRVTSGMNLRFIAGADEFYVIDGTFRRGADAAKRRGANVDSFIVPGCGHFFLLQKRDETIATLRRWLAE
jgi:pimeloyl-ACP methyl ester carboxylesterase